ncbi:MAG: methylene-tetrahydromethanopterin dehydrogenase N-terminal domain-containing protein, partial [Pirellulaceae bacterium]
MSQKKSVLLQLDPDIQASSFDALVAIDAGVDVLLSRSGVQESHVASLVHGMIFT